MASRLITLRYPGSCSCGVRLERGAKAWHDAETKSVQCSDCHARADLADAQAPSELRSTATDGPEASPSSLAQEALEIVHQTTAVEPLAFASGVGGAAARHEYERRKAKDDAKLAERHAFWRAANRFFYPDGRQTTHAWKVGAEGEERLARVLEGLMESGVGYPLHDRRMPGSRGNINHLFVGPGGVFVIDAKHFKGADISIDYVGGLFSPRVEFLKVDGRQRKGLLEGVLKQAEAIWGALASTSFAEIPVTPMLCFVDGLLPARKSKRVAQGVQLVTLKGIAEHLSRSGTLAGEATLAVAMALNTAMPPMRTAE